MEVWRKLPLLAFILATNNVVMALSPSSPDDVKIVKRHTPFLPGDYWKDKRPEFGDTQTDVEVMVNATAKLKCPITHVADSSVSKYHMYFLACAQCTGNGNITEYCICAVLQMVMLFLWLEEVVVPRLRKARPQGSSYSFKG